MDDAWLDGSTAEKVRGVSVNDRFNMSLQNAEVA